MSAPVQSGLVLLTAALLAVPCAAQQEPDLVIRPLRPFTRAELDRREALLLFGQAAEHEHRNRLPEALKTYEKALRLDPDAAPVLRALVPLYQALDRQQESLDASKRVVELEPEDYETWHTYARQLRAANRDAEARKALMRAVACKKFKERPEAQLSALQDLGALHEKLKDDKGAESAFRELIVLLESPAAQELEGIGKEEIVALIADTYERVGRLCLRMDQIDRAVEAFKNAQGRDPARIARLSFNLAEVFAAQKRDAEALRYTDAYLARQPQGVEGYELKLKLLRRLGREDEALPALERHSRNDPYHNALRLLLAREYQKAGQLGDAERIYLALMASPQVEVYRGLFSLYRLEGRRGAEKLFDRLDRAIAAASPEEKDNKKPVGDATQAAHVRAMLSALREDRELVGALLPVALDRILKGPKSAYKTRLFVAILAERTGQLDTAENLYRSCLDSEGRVQEFGPKGQNESEVYGGLLRVLSMGRKHQAVLTLCKQGLEHAEATNRVMFHLDEAHALMSLGQTKESLVAAQAAVDTSGERDRLVCRRVRAELLAQAGQYKEAEEECLGLLKDFKEDEEVRSIRFALSNVYSRAKQSEKSEEQLKIILKADPLDAHANNDLAYLWAERGKNLAEAERMIRKAVELDRLQRNTKDSLGLDADRDNAAYVDSLGWVLFRRGRLKEAREQLEKAARLPDGAQDPVVWDHLGDVCFRLKESKKATDAWHRALTLFEKGQRPRSDDRYKDIEQKLKQAGEER